MIQITGCPATEHYIDQFCYRLYNEGTRLGSVLILNNWLPGNGTCFSSVLIQITGCIAKNLLISKKIFRSTTYTYDFLKNQGFLQIHSNPASVIS